ncbi:MAG: glycosyltransferase [Gammaproteobacteria bacterium]|nr:glycosyltransferase [Gammaproteobacteria bacterium]
MKIAFVYMPGRRHRLAAARAGSAASEFFYGALQLEAAGHDVTIHEIPEGVPASLGVRVGDRLAAMDLMPFRTTGTLLAQVKPLLGALARADAVVATTTGLAFSLALAAWLSRRRLPLVGIHCGMLNSRHGFARRSLSRWLMRGMQPQLFGVGELAGLSALLGLPESGFQVNQFGVDTGFWCPGPGEAGEYLLSVGNDGRRDFTLLCRAARQLDIEVRIITRLALPDDRPDNVQVIHGDLRGLTLDDQALRRLYRGARGVVVPLLESPQPAGQSVALQAMACGRPVVLTRTAGLWKPDELRNADNVYLVPPGDEAALVAALAGLHADPHGAARVAERGREYVLEHGDIRNFALRIESGCRKAAHV